MFPSLNPLKSGHFFRLKLLEYEKSKQKVSIPSNRGISSDVEEATKATVEAAVSIPSNRGISSDYPGKSQEI